MSFMEDLLAKLREFDALRDGEAGKDGKDKVAKECLDAIPPEYADTEVFAHLSQKLQDALRKRGISRFYRHQAEAILVALEGENVVLQAPTASGKSLAFQVPMLESLLREANGHALMLYPTKALAFDQRDQLEKLSAHIQGREIESWWYDGDTTRDERKPLRENPPPILITNPDMLHSSFLAHADQWRKFFSGLKWVIVDEIHEYRGYFGSNVSLLLRRFSHHLAQQGVHPRFFLSSATCANAKEHAENLTGLSFAEVKSGNKLRPRRRFYFIQPGIIPKHRYWDIFQLRTIMAGLACLACGKSVIAFCPTRKFAEACCRTAVQKIEELHKQGETRLNAEEVKVFRSGLQADERREIQTGLKNGSVNLVFATNALELGLDIGGLDGVILAGFPDNMMSAWQRIGRAGRDWQSDAFVLYYALNNPLDQFYASNLNAFLEKPLDSLVVNPGNEDLIGKHVPSLMFETPKLDGGQDILGEALYKVVADKLKSGAQRVQSGNYRPHIHLDMRGGGGGNFELQDGSSRTIGTISRQHRFREAYLRAIYLHGGRKYRVEGTSETTSGSDTITLGPVDQHLRTDAPLITTIGVSDIYDGRKWTSGDIEVEVYYGKVLITEALRLVREIDERTGEERDRWHLQASAKFGDAHACWVHQVTESNEALAGTTALQHLLRIGAIFCIPLDTHDIFPHASSRERTAYIIECYPGGIGIASGIFKKWQELLKEGIRVAEKCDCVEGCPNCIVPPRSQDKLDKTVGISLARSLLAATEKPHNKKYVNNIWELA